MVAQGNEIIFSADDFYISYREERSEFAKICDTLCYLAGRPEPKDLPETALVQCDGMKFFILYGDHRDTYRALIPDFDACMSYFLEHIEQIGHSSDTPEAQQ